MRHGSLFSGIGGFDLAAQWAGWENVFQVEIDPWCRRVLSKHFPNAQRFTDIREFDGIKWRGAIDVISGGFPCQPFSSAGKRLGKEDERHLWPEMLRVIREAKPKWVVGENVRGLVNWSEGMVFDEVQSDLEAAGYEIISFILPAASVNAPHERYRVWFVAHRSGKQMGATGQPRKYGGMEDVANTNHTAPTRQRKNGRGILSEPKSEGFSLGCAISSDTNNERCKKRHTSKIAGCPGQPAWRDITEWAEWTTEPPVCRMDDGVPNRMDRIRGLGNAIVPQVALQIFETINRFDI